MQRRQWDKPQNLQQDQLTLLRLVVGNAARQVPYYSNLFKNSGFSPSEIRDLDDFGRIPVSTKSMIRRAYPDQVYNRSSWLDMKVSTSGSTGEPFEAILDGKNHGWRLASRYLFDSWMGIAPGERWIHIFGHSRLTQRLRRHLLQGELQVAADLTSKERFSEIIRLLVNYKPSGMSGVSTSLALLAKHMQDAGISFTDKLRGVFSCAEMLSHDQKQLISSVLSTNLYDRYGLRESAYIAQDCEYHRGLHINSLLVYAEVVAGDRMAAPGEAGKLIITDLRNNAMPLIRYDTGDLASIEEECECGRGFPMLGELFGRENDYIATRFGLLPALAVMSKLGNQFVQFIHDFQLATSQNGNVLVRIVPTHLWTPQVEARVTAFLAGYFEDFNVKLVTEIKPEPSGKKPMLKSLGSRDV
jgi:phenylacetate-CoA ligase